MGSAASWTTERRREFQIFVVDQDFSEARRRAGVLKTYGYEQSKFFPTLGSALVVAQSELPHVLLYTPPSHESLETELQSIAHASDETRVILLVDQEMALTAMQMISKKLAFDHLLVPQAIDLQILQAIDRSAQGLFFQFESEQLRDYYRAKADEKGFPPPPEQNLYLHEVLAQNNVVAQVIPGFQGKLSSTHDFASANQVYCETLSRLHSDSPVLYFKYLPMHTSLLLSQGAGLQMSQFEGLGVELKKYPLPQIEKFLLKPSELQDVAQMAELVLKQQKFITLPSPMGATHGFYMILAKATPDRSRLALTLAQNLFQMLASLKKFACPEELQRVVGRSELLQSIEEEIRRARRLSSPVSLITLQIDEGRKRMEQMGPTHFQAVIKSILLMLLRSTRMSDVIAQTEVASSLSHISILMPHANAEMAAIKAERIRRLIAGTKFPIIETRGLSPIAISCGVSEYPSMAKESMGLWQTADEALRQVENSGGHRVCMASAPREFIRDFEPSVVSVER